MIDKSRISPMFRVCILNWNGGNDLKECIDSIRINTYENYKITIIDNNSSDSSLSLLQEDIEVISLKENYGFSRGYNIGLQQCINNQDEYIILLNFDTLVGPTFIQDIANNIKESKSKYIYGVKILYNNKKDIIWYAGGKVQLGKGIISHIGIKNLDEKYTEDYETGYVTGCCMIMHKDIFFELEGFDQKFFMYNEDVDFCLRAKEKSIKCKFLANPKIFHKVSLSIGGNSSLKKISMKIKSGYFLYRKYYPFFIAMVLLIQYFLSSSFICNKIGMVQMIPSLNSFFLRTNCNSL